MAHLVSSSTTLAYPTNINLHQQGQVKNWQMTICIEEKLDVLSQLAKCK
jgi:hypothetical protein